MMILALLLSVLPGEQPAFDVAAFVDTEVDCPVRRYGGRDEAFCDLAPAAERALAACYARVSTWAGDRDVPCDFEWPTGTFVLSRTVEACHAVRFRGYGTKILTLGEITPIYFMGHAACTASGRPKATGSEISGIILQPFAATSTNTITYGILAEAPLEIGRVQIRGGYTQGIRISAGSGRSPASLANRWRLDGVSVQGAHHVGVWVDGEDTNVGLALGASSAGNCLKAAPLAATLGPCAEIHEGSFLGSTWIAAHAAYAESLHPNVPVPYMMGDSGNSRSVCIGCYAEDPGVGVVANNANILGGKSVWSGFPIIQGTVFRAAEFTNDNDPANTVTLGLGRLATGLGSVFSVQANGWSGGTALRLKVDRPTFSYRLDVGNLNSAQALRIGANSSAIGGAGGVILRPNNTLPNVYINTTNYVVPRQAP